MRKEENHNWVLAKTLYDTTKILQSYFVGFCLCFNTEALVRLIL